MGKIFETKINRFDGGKSKDLRTVRENEFSVATHFDVFSTPHKMLPNRGLEAEENVPVSSKGDALIQKFLYINNAFFGLGQISSGDAKTQVYEKSAGGSNFLDHNWVKATGGAASTGGAETKAVFFGYKNRIYGFNNSGVWEYDTVGNSFSDSDVSNIGSQTNVAQPVHHSADDIAYFFADNEVHSLNDTTWSASADLTLPSNLRIVSCDSLGNYLAIGCTPTDTYGGEATIYLWDRDSSLTTISEKIGLEQDELIHIATLENLLMSVSRISDSIAGGGIAQLVIRQGGGIINKIKCKDVSFSGNKVVYDNKLYFVMRLLDLNNEVQQGIWSVDVVGRLNLEVIDEDVVTNTAPPPYNGIYRTSNIWWIAHSNDGSIDRTVDTASYLNTSIYESQIFATENSSLKKDLLGVTVNTTPLLTAGQIVLQYRINQNIGGSWTTIFTEGTDNSISFSAVNDLPKDYKEIQFRIESTGGAEITGLTFKEEVTGKRNYA